MFKYTINIQGPLLWMMVLLPLIFTISCERYNEETYELNELEQVICDRFSDTLSHELKAADLRLFGPSWTGKEVEQTLLNMERIGSTWFNADFELEPDVFVFLEGADTVAAMQILDFVYDDALVSMDSIYIAYLYNPAGTPAFGGLVADTILVLDPGTTPLYLDFSQGVVGASDDWNISLDGVNIKQASLSKVFRLENRLLAAFTTAPKEYYAADILGFELAVNYLEADTIYLTETDSLLSVGIESSTDAGYMLWNRQGMGSSEIIFNTTDYMTIAIWDESGIYLDPSDVTMSMQTVAYCWALKTKVAYELDESTYLVQFLPHEEMATAEFDLVIVEGE